MDDRYELYNDDCMNVLPKLKGKSIDSIITDIPYGIVNETGMERAQYDGQLRSLNKEFADAETFRLDEFLPQLNRVAKGSIYIFCGYQQLSDIFKYFYDDKNFMVRVCFWHKTNPSPMNGQHMYLNAVEPIVFAKRRKGTFNAMCKHNWFKCDIEDTEFMKHPEV